jgi:ribosomal protein L37AE/L43A
MSADTPPHSHQTRQATNYCPFCGEETLFPREEGGWECRSCARAFSVTFHGIVSARLPGGGAPR